jgi:hypothetical protein
MWDPAPWDAAVAHLLDRRAPDASRPYVSAPVPPQTTTPHTHPQRC